jgi:ribulose-phosphate 3-epimerase
MARSFIFAPSILSADFACLKDQIAAVEAAGAGWIHIDVMDGHFVPNLTMGPFIVEACRRITSLPLDVHLMVEAPERMIEAFAKAGANLLSVHIENSPHIHRTLQTIRQLGCQVGVVLNPGTSALVVKPVLHMTDYVLVMSVNPGFSGQTFIPETVSKIAELREMIEEINPNVLIEVDGGISAETLPETARAGARVFVASSAIFNHPEGIEAGMRALKASIPDIEG